MRCAEASKKSVQNLDGVEMKLEMETDELQSILIAIFLLFTIYCVTLCNGGFK